jgi:hypothetical protein
LSVPVNLSFTSSAVDFEGWWSMWKTHVFRKALGPMLQQIHPEYAIPVEEVPPLIGLSSFNFYWPPFLTPFSASAARRWPRADERRWIALLFPGDCSGGSLRQECASSLKKHNADSAEHC